MSKNALFIAGAIEDSQRGLMKSVITQFCQCVEDAVLIDKYRSNKLRRVIGYDCDAEIIKYIPEAEDWVTEFNNAKRFIEENGITSMFVIKTAMFTGYRSDGDYSVKKFYSNFEEKTTQMMKFESMKKVLQNLVFVKACEDIRVIQLVIDPYEHSYPGSGIKDFSRYYILSKGQDKYCPMYEACLPELENRKEYVFYFAASLLCGEREFLREMSEDFEGISDRFVFFYFDRYKFKNRKVSQEEYYENISKSLFTLIIQSYDVTTFSIIRFFEAIKNSCVPLIWRDVDLTDLKNTFEDIYGLVIRYGLVVGSKEEILEACKKKNRKHYEEFLNAVKNSKSYKKINDKELIKKFYKKLLNK